MTESKVDALSPAVEEMAEHWPLIQALVGGTSAMRKAGPRFLPQFPKEPDDAYKIRLGAAVLFPAFTHTASVMAAKPFARPVKIENLPAPIADLLEDVDRAGADFVPYLAMLFEEAMAFGLVGVLVDHPVTPDIKTLAEAEQAGARPYFAKYQAASILGWRVDGGELTLLRLMETVTEPDGPFGETVVQQIRVLRPGAWETYRKRRDERTGVEGWALHASGVTSIRRIPFVFFYGLRKGYGVGLPPLLELAHMNVEHWQSSSEQQNILHVARVPILFASGFTEGDDLTVGANSVVRAYGEQADLRYVEHSGSAIGAGRQALIDLEDRMRQAGAELLIQRPAVTTATQFKGDAEGVRCLLQKIAEAFEESAEQALALMGEWLNLPCAPEVELFKDFGANNLADAAGDLLLRAEGQGVVSRETAFNELKRMDVVALDVTWDDEQKRLAAHAQADLARRVEETMAMAAAAPPPAPGATP